MTRMTFKPVRWLRPSVRYQFQMRDYRARVEDLANVTSRMDSHIFNFDVSIQPLQNLLVMTGLSPQYAWIETPSRFIGNGGSPRFQANVLTWMLNLNYDVSESVSLTSGFDCAVASNFNDNSAGGLPLGAAYHQMDFSAGVHWKITKQIGLQLDYAFYRYAANAQVDSGDYHANLVTLKTKFEWA